MKTPDVLPSQISTGKKFVTFTGAVIVALIGYNLAAYAVDKYTRGLASKARQGVLNLGTRAIDALPGGQAPAVTEVPAAKVVTVESIDATSFQQM